MSRIRMILWCTLLLTHTGLIAENVHLQRTPSGNTYISASEIVLSEPTSGDLVVAAGKLQVEKEVKSDAALAGGSVEVLAPIGQDLRIAGGTVTVAAPVGGELVAVGGNIELRDAAHITGSAWIAGRNVNFRGSADEIRIFARSFRLEGQIRGNAHIVAQQISFAPGARIEGNLRYTSPDPLSQEMAGAVDGTLDYEPVISQEGKTGAPAPSSHGGIWLTVLLMLSFWVMALLTHRLFPAAVRASQETYASSPGKSFLLGIALLFSIPPVAILALVTIIGIPIGLILLVLYPILLLAGYLGTLFAIAAKSASMLLGVRTPACWQQAAFLALAILILCLVTWIPFAGGAILSIATVTGMGAWIISLYRQFWATG